MSNSPSEHTIMINILLAVKAIQSNTSLSESAELTFTDVSTTANIFEIFATHTSRILFAAFLAENFVDTIQHSSVQLHRMMPCHEGTVHDVRRSAICEYDHSPSIEDG
jgi:hypothetical protein